MQRPSEALDRANKLIGRWPHARPPNAQMWISGLASVLAKYPAEIADECIDPRRGLPLVREFPPTITSVAEWCDARLEWYQALASYVPVPPARQIEPGPKTADDIAALLNGLADQLRSDTKRSPLDELIDQRAAMRRESVERVLLYADRIAPKPDAAP